MEDSGRVDDEDGPILEKVEMFFRKHSPSDLSHLFRSVLDFCGGSGEFLYLVHFLEEGEADVVEISHRHD